jgi:hypothetical protein
MQASGREESRIRKSECRMSNKEFRMMKLNLFSSFLRRSSFVIRPARCALSGISASRVFLMNVTTTVSVQSVSQGRRVFCGSLLSVDAD